MSLGSRIKEYRVKRGYTQSQMAAKLDMTEANFSSYERDKSNPPSEKLSMIASILGVSSDYLLFGNESASDKIRDLIKSYGQISDDSIYFEDGLKVASKYVSTYGGRINEDQLIKFAINGLQIALQNFDPSRNVRFTTFASRCIENEIWMGAKREGISLGNTYSNLIAETPEQYAPTWASKQDIIDIKKILETGIPVSFDGMPLTEEQREKIRLILTGSLWEALAEHKKKN